MVFIEAGAHVDGRSPTDDRVQPWRIWWPPAPYNSSVQNTRDDTLAREPWLSWRFSEQRPFEKPWLEWALPKPKNHNKLSDSPEVRHELDFIHEQLKTLSADELSSFNPIRTNTYLQFFQQNPENYAEKPYVCKIPPPVANQAQINFGGCYKKVMITNVRGHEDLFELDKHGFQFASHKLGSHEVVLDVESYCRQMAMWLREYLHAQEVFVFDRTLRSADTVKAKGFVDIARRVHCGEFKHWCFIADTNPFNAKYEVDQSPRSAVGRIKLHMGDRAANLLRGRCRIINIWRPLVPVVESDPLAMCRFDSILPADFVPTDVIFPHYAEESFEIRPRSTQRWYYRSNHTHDELTLLKIYDNKEGVAFCSPHSSFRDPLGLQTSTKRSSIELRCLVFSRT